MVVGRCLLCIVEFPGVLFVVCCLLLLVGRYFLFVECPLLFVMCCALSVASCWPPVGVCCLFLFVVC